MTTGSENVAIVRRVLEAFAASGDAQPLYDAVTDDVVFELIVPPGAPLGREYRGPDGMRRFYAQADALMELLQFEILDYLGNDARVVVVGRERYRARKRGTEHDTAWVLHFELAAGRIARMQSFEDLSGLVEAAP